MINLKNIQTEVDASFLYAVLAEKEKDNTIASIYKEMSDIECSHAIAFLEKNGMTKSQYPQPSFRAKLIKTLGGWFGADFILGILLNTEKSLASSIQTARSQTKTKVSLSDTAHVVILKNIIEKNNIEGTNLAQFEKRHRSVGGNALRAAVLGGNDGLVSNFSLVMGIAGATNGQKEVLLAGMAGLLAGALSMALGEWISVKSSQELYENQMQLEMDELEHNPEGEERELALIYMSKGIETTKAKQMANEVMKDKNQAHEVLVREELGINSEELKGSAMEAALASFFFFAIGALLPVIPFFFMSGLDATLTSASLSALGLFLIGAIITLFTGKSMLYSGMRQVIFGLAAAAITYSIGKWIGVSLI
jgi:VIT1/CCC1 family predicted Fe2+/Mn2+ transporter